MLWKSANSRPWTLRVWKKEKRMEMEERMRRPLKNIKTGKKRKMRMMKMKMKKRMKKKIKLN